MNIYYEHVDVPVGWMEVIPRKAFFKSLATDDLCSCIGLVVITDTKIVMIHFFPDIVGIPGDNPYYGLTIPEYVGRFFQRMEQEEKMNLKGCRAAIAGGLKGKEASAETVEAIEREVGKHQGRIEFRDVLDLDSISNVRQIILRKNLQLEVYNHETTTEHGEREEKGKLRYLYDFNTQRAQDLRNSKPSPHAAR